MSYFCHDCGTVIEEDDTNLCGKCAKKQHPTPMTNPAVEALKPCAHCGSSHVRPVKVDIKYERNSCFRVKCDSCGAYGPPASIMAKNDSMDYDGAKERAISAWNRRAQAEQTPVDGRVVSEELFSRIDDFLTDCEVGFHGYGPEEPKTLATAILKELRAQPSETVRREGE